MFKAQNYQKFYCPHCDHMNYKDLARDAEMELVCSRCKEPIEVKTDVTGAVMRVRKLANVADLLKTTSEKSTPRTQTRSDTQSDSPSVTIGTVYGNVSFGGDVNVTNIYNETLEFISNAKATDEKKSEAKRLLEFAKNNAPNFLSGVAEIIKIFLGQA